MKENEIVICGHGSGTPSIKNLDVYLTSRYNALAKNGVRKGLVEVRRLKALTEIGRQAFHDTYQTIIGRNIYSQSNRQYVYEAKNGRYYSDCSSSICATFKYIGYNISLLNTAGMHESKLFETVDVKIVNGHIMNPEKLRVGDILLFAGEDPDRPLQIGHVEAVYSMPVEHSVGWEKDSADIWHYYEPDASGNPVRFEHGWKLINHHWYYFYQGNMKTGWQNINGSWYYLSEKGDLEGACYHETDKHDGSLEVWTVG